MGEGTASGDRAAQAVVLFADLAGFTTLAERLTSSGHLGTEELHCVLNRYFGRLITSISAAGGEVTTFAGDALAAVFPVSAGHALDGTAAAVDATALTEAGGRAYRCARHIQADQRRSGGPSIRIGLSAGQVTRVLLGDAQRSWHVMAGRGLSHAVDAQASIGPGEVGVHATLELDALDVIDEVTSGDADTESLDLPGGSLLDEHRIVTTVFVGLPDLGVPDDKGARLQAYLDVALPVIRRYDGDLRQIDAGDKGYQLVLGFGAPRTSADDAERAVACAHELVALTGPAGIRECRAGVATGPAFCAVLGTQRRSEYVVIGDSVNVAARLAQAAEVGEAWLDGATALRCTSAVLRPLGARPLKGRRTAIEVFAAEGFEEIAEPRPAPGVDEHTSFVGRDDQLELALRRRRWAHTGRGQVLLIHGEPGVGKSRLVARLLEGDPERVLVGGGRGPGDRRPYVAWRPIARALTMEPGWTSGPITLLSGIAQDDRTPLLGPVLGLDIADTPLTARLDPAGRADATRALLLDCLRRATMDGPLTIVVDDAHWLDELSRDALVHVATHLDQLPVLLVVATRDEPRAATLLEALLVVPHATSLRLGTLSSTEAAELVAATSARLGAVLSAEVVTAIAQRGAGNPLFLEQLVQWACDTRDGSSTADAPLELPPDVERLVLARVDRLTPAGRTALKAASVVEDDISAAAVVACLVGTRGAPDRPGVELAMAELAAADLVAARPGGNDHAETAYGFRHALVHEVVYGSLSSASRAELHENMGDYLHASHTDDTAGYLDLLAHHYGRSRHVGKQRIWFRAAGEAAARAYANDAALRYYERLTPLVPDDEAAEVLLLRGGVLALIGRWDEAEADLTRAAGLARSVGKPLVAASAEREIGLVLLATRRYDEAVERLRAAADELGGLGDTSGQVAALDRLAFALFEHGRYDEAREVAGRQLALVGGDDALSGAGRTGADQLGADPPDLARVSAALGLMGIVEWGCDRFAEALTLLRRAYTLARRSGDRRQIVHVANDLAGLYAERGDHRRAVLYLGIAVRTASHIGYRQATTYLTGNAGELYLDHGDFAEANRHFATGLRAALDLGDWITTTRCVVGLAITAADQGAPDRHVLLRRACAVAGELHQSYVLAGVQLRRARAAYDDGDLEAAWPLVHEAEASARRLSEHGVALRPLLLRLRVAVATSRMPTADAIAQVRALLPQWPDAPERAALLETLSVLDPADAVTRAEAASLYRDLFRTAGSRDHARAYAMLTGGLEGLPEPVVLPRIAVAITSVDAVAITSVDAVDAIDAIDIDALLTRVERLAVAHGEPSGRHPGGVGEERLAQ